MNIDAIYCSMKMNSGIKKLKTNLLTIQLKEKCS